MIQRREENDRRNFMIKLHESMGPGRDRTRDPWICLLPDTLPTELRGPVGCVQYGWTERWMDLRHPETQFKSTNLLDRMIW